MNLQKELHELQRLLAQTDLLFEPRRGGSNPMELLLVKRKRMKLKIYQEVNHMMPHIHIDYGKDHHTASYSIETGEKIEGTLPRMYDRDVNRWIDENQKKLFEVWNTLQAGENYLPLVTELQADA